GCPRVGRVGSTRIGLLDAEIERRCAVAALGGVGRVAAPGGVVFEVPQGQAGPGGQGRPGGPGAGATGPCFPPTAGAWLLVQPVGEGTVVRLGGASVLVNQ